MIGIVRSLDRRTLRYEKGREETVKFVKTAAGRRLCRCAAAARVRIRTIDALERWRTIAAECRDFVANAAAVEIERYCRSYRAKQIVEWRRRRRAATRIQTRQRQLPARVELARLREEKRRNDAATKLKKWYGGRRPKSLSQGRSFLSAPPSGAGRGPAAGCHVDIPRESSLGRAGLDRLDGRSPFRLIRAT